MTPLAVLGRRRIKVWVCAEPDCGFWRRDQGKGHHQVAPLNDGRWVTHLLREAEFEEREP